MPDRIGADHNTPVTEYLEGGVVRIRTVAGQELAHRMAVAEYASMRWVWVVLGLALIFGPALITVTERERGGPFFTADLLVALVGGVLVFAFIALGAIFRTNPTYWRLSRLPIGTTVYSDVTPDWIGIGWSDRYTALARSQIDRIRECKSVLVITARGQKIFVPRELMPAGTANELRNQPPRRGEFGVMTAHVNARPPRPPMAADLNTDQDRVVRTHATADRTLADRLAGAVRQSSALRTAALLLMMLPLAAVIAYFVDDERHLWYSMFLPLMLMGIAGYCLLGYHMFFGVRAHLRHLVPEGAPLSAEFGPTWVSVQVNGYFEAVGATRITKMERVDAALIMTIQGPVEGLSPRRSSEGLLIPAELAPHSADDLLNRYR